MNKTITEQRSYDSQVVLFDHDKFRARLEINQDLFESLKSVSDLGKIISVSHTLTRKKKFAVSEIFSKMNGIGQLAFATTLTVLKTGWAPGNLEPIRMGSLQMEMLLKSSEKAAEGIESESKDSILGLMAGYLLELLIYPSLKIAYADGDFTKDERSLIIEMWNSEWGYRKSFVKEVIERTETNLERFTYTDFADNIRELARVFPEINFEETRDELIGTVKNVIQADGFIHPNEQKELDEFVDYLCHDSAAETKNLQVNNFWDFIFKRETEKKETKVTDILKKIPLFDHLTGRELKIVSKLIHTRTYQPGEYIFQKDQPGAAMFIIKQGSVKIVLPGKDDTEILLATLKPGTFLGELALLDNSPRSASARAVETTEALAFFRSELNKLLKTYPVIGSKILKKLALIIGQRLKATNEQLYKK